MQYLTNPSLLDALVLVFTWFFLFFYFQPRYLFSQSITTGGDTASHYYTAWYLKNVLLGEGRLSGWCMGNLGGFPILEYYFPLPFLMAALLSLATGLPVAFKLVTVSGVFLLPPATYLFFRLTGARFPVPAAGAISSLVFLFMGGNTMWGGNIASTLAGEFTYSIGLALAVLFLGIVYRAVERGRGIIFCAFLLAAVGLCHAYALLFCGTAMAFFLFRPKKFIFNFLFLCKIHLTAFGLLGFWILPLLANLPNTTRFNILWVFSDWPQVWAEIFPSMMRPWAVTGLLSMVLAVALARVHANRPLARTAAYLLFLCGLGLAMYFLGYRARVVDVRFLPFFQFFLIVSAALALALLPRAGKGAAVLAFLALTVGVFLWIDSQETFLPSWIRNNYAGFEKKPLWSSYQDVNRRLAGGPGQPRVVYEHSTIHEQAGTVRAFESLPLFSGRSTLEGVYIQASPASPFVYYIQSELSPAPSTPIPEFCYSRFDPERALAHLELFNTGQVVAASEEAKEALDNLDQFQREYASWPYAIYKVKNFAPAYCVEMEEPALVLPREDFPQKAFAWFRLGDPRRLPVFINDPGPEIQKALAGESGWARKPAAALTQSLEQEKITIENATPGRPVLVKVAYHPGWKAKGARGPFLAGPGLMAVIPSQSHVELNYGKTAAGRLGLLLTLAMAGLVLFFGLASQSGAARAISRAFDRLAPWVLLPVAAALLTALAFFLAKGPAQYPTLAFERAVAPFAKKDYEEACPLLEQVLEQHPCSLISDEAAFHLAMGRFSLGQWEQSARDFSRMLRDYPDSRRVPEARYHLGMCFTKRNQTEPARQIFLDLARDFPSGVWAEAARARLKELNAGK